jgi:hypothetical protein
MIPDARHEVAPLALASRKQDLDDVPFPARFNRRAFPGENRGEAPTTCSLRLLNGLAIDFRLY